ncbi:hypothetical protein [Dyella ginsengisoli]|uniref:hypothetical protein n=1 Tax=Dyella ginsengisoli TaxID=363848 RepID=UPI00037DF055|nr:hypothetical protein [Dyella ginsengisoli]
MDRVPRKRRGKRLDHEPRADLLARLLGIFTLLYTASSSLGGYLWVTRVQQHLDEKKFLQSNVSLISALKPIALVSCYNTVDAAGDLENVMVIKNTGAYAFRITKVSRELRATDDNHLLSSPSEMIPTYANGMDMDISPGQTATSTMFYAKSGGIRPWEEIEVAGRVELATPDVMLGYVKKVLGDAVDPAALSSFGSAMLRCRGMIEAGGAPTH